MGSDRGHYAELDLPLVTRLGGVLWLLAAAYASALAPLAPPDALIGGAGWVVFGALVAAAAAFGVRLAGTARPLPPDRLLLLDFAGLAFVATCCLLAEAGSPYLELLVLVACHAAAVHPASRTLAVLGVGSLVALAPLAADGAAATDVAGAAARVLLVWGLAGMTYASSARLRELRREVGAQREAALEQARHDELTGLGNRRALEEALAVARAVVARTRRPLAAFVLDLDDFKLVNDSWGHGAGDAALADVAAALRDTLRRPDACFRWGGDEFVVLLPDTTIGEAELVAGRLVAAVADRCRRPDGAPLSVTTGTASLRAGETGPDLLARADLALVAAKAAGRRVGVAEDAEDAAAA